MNLNLLVVGVSYRTADVSLLEKLAVADGELPDLLRTLLAREHVTEAVVLSTCNRVEVYAGVSSFHGGLTQVSSALAERAGTDPAALTGHLHVRWDSDAVSHVLRVAAGLDSLVVGEAQILGQLREAYAVAADADAAGRLLHELMQQALRVGKRVHAETGIDTAGRSMVTAALELAARETSRPDQTGGLVVGTGAMGSLALATLARAEVTPLFVAGRDPARTRRAAETHGAEAVGLDDLAGIISGVDLVVSATASPDAVLSAATVERARARRRTGRGPVVICDLAVPRDVEPAVAEQPGVVLIGMERLAAAVAGSTADTSVAERIVAVETATIVGGLRDERVAPTVAALRARADEVVAAELARLAQRRPDLTEEQRAEVHLAVHRLVQRLLHQPTVRVRQLAAGPGGETYPAVLAELFDLRLPRTSRADQVPDIDGETAGGDG